MDITDSLKQIENQYSDTNSPVLGWLVKGSVPLLQAFVLGDIRGAGLTALGLVTALWGERRIKERLERWRTEVTEILKSRREPEKVDFDQLKDATGETRPEVDEAMATSLIISARSVRSERVQLNARVIAHAVLDRATRWDEVSMLLHDLERLGDRDVELVKLLWSVQAIGAQPDGPGELSMRPDPNIYQRTWGEVVGLSKMSVDELSSGCGRLAGFGLAVLLPPNGRYQRPEDLCYRLTSRAIRLLRLIDPEFVTTGRDRIVAAHQEAQLRDLRR